MAEPSIDVEKVVRKVLAELSRARGPGADAVEKTEAGRSPAPSRPAPGAETPVPAASGEPERELVVGSQVVTMAELEGRLDAVRRLVVPPQSVVTPSVRDELHRRGIILVYDRRVAAASAQGVRLVVTVLGSGFDPAPLVRALGNEGIEVDVRQTDCLVDATDQLAGELARPNVLGLLLTADPAAALCLANRHRRVRAVLGTDAAAASAAAASVGANLLVVNSRTAGLFALKQMATRFCREGPRACPEPLRERLG